MATLFTSDTHFGHAKMLDLNSRPYLTVGEMDTAIINAWNEAVGPDDVVWHLGDFSSYRDGRLEEVFWRLNGREKHLIIGNHDEENDLVMALPWSSEPQKHELVWVDGQAVFLDHYPTLGFPKIGKGAIHLFGHLHGKWPGSRRMLDVGVDVWGRPVGLPDIMRKLRKLPDLNLFQGHLG